jgi:hypothetical protein
MESKPVRRYRRVPHGALDIAVPEIGLQRARVGAGWFTEPILSTRAFVRFL